MRVLAVDTTTPRGSIALVEDDTLLGELRHESAEGHSRWLIPAVSSLLAGLPLQAADVDGFAVAIGPGSFTGLRVGIATVQGLALAAARPCLGISALDALASLAVGAADTIVAMINAYRDDVFAGVYDREGNPLAAPRLASPESVLGTLPGSITLVGDGATQYRDRIVRCRPDAAFPDRELFLAPALGRRAAVGFARGEGVAPALLRPLYLREADIRT